MNVYGTEMKSIFDEICSLLKAELVCAESLQATAQEIQALSDRAQFEQIQERLFSRNQILDTMLKLDERMSFLVKNYRSELDEYEWAELNKGIESGKNTFSLKWESARKRFLCQPR